MIHFLVPAAEHVLIKDYLDVHGKSLRDNIRILHYEDLAQPREFIRGTYVLAALDRLTPAIAQLLFEMHQQLKQIDGIRFLNHPRKTLQRFELLSELSLRGRNDFRAVRASMDLKSLRFPVFLREERLHEGAISPLLNSFSELRQAIGRALVQGHKLKNLLVVEFCDTANEEGFYRKYGAFVVGTRVIPRSLNYGRHWMLKHSQTEFTMPMVREELEYVSQNPHQQQLLEIFNLAQVEYGRIDYSLKDGKVQTWEINLNPTIGRGLRPRSRIIAADLDAVRDEVRHCFYEGFERAWREVDLPTKPEPPILMSPSPQLIRAANIPVESPNRLLTAIRSILRPAKPLLEPVIAPFLLTVCWLGRLVSRERS
jgi:hypothetical protein